VIYTSNTTENRISVFAAGACGDVAPIRIIEGDRTGLAEPRGLALDARGRLYVANRKTATATVYAPDAQGDATPLRMLSAVAMRTAEAIAVAPEGDVFVAGCADGALAGRGCVVRFAPDSSHSTCTIAGHRTGLTYPVGLALADDGALIVANAFGGVVAAYAAQSRGDAAPLRSFTAATASTRGIACGARTLLVSGTSVYLYPSGAGAGAQPTAVLARCPMLPLGAAGAVAIRVAKVPPVILVGVADSMRKAVHLIRTSGVAPAIRIAAVASIAGPATGLTESVGGLVFA
jgi:DNA-binding beta-propeller fold protein YncE